jgi:hypothetical protein
MKLGRSPTFTGDSLHCAICGSQGSLACFSRPLSNSKANGQRVAVSKSIHSKSTPHVLSLTATIIHKVHSDQDMFVGWHFVVIAMLAMVMGHIDATNGPDRFVTLGSSISTSSEIASSILPHTVPAVEGFRDLSEMRETVEPEEGLDFGPVSHAVKKPTAKPTKSPTKRPSVRPTRTPTAGPTNPTSQPSNQPTGSLLVNRADSQPYNLRHVRRACPQASLQASRPSPPVSRQASLLLQQANHLVNPRVPQASLRADLPASPACNPRVCQLSNHQRFQQRNPRFSPPASPPSNQRVFQRPYPRFNRLASLLFNQRVYRRLNLRPGHPPCPRAIPPCPQVALAASPLQCQVVSLRPCRQIPPPCPRASPPANQSCHTTSRGITSWASWSPVCFSWRARRPISRSVG